MIYKNFSVHFNAVIREVIFADEELKALLLIPDKDKDNLFKFQTHYFQDLITDVEPIESRKALINYYENKASSANHKNIRNKTIEFDVFVNEKHLYGADEDNYMLPRTRLIFERMKKILCDSGKVKDIDFRCIDDYPMVSRTAGYVRHHFTLEYKRIY